jgi:nitroreductase
MEVFEAVRTVLSIRKYQNKPIPAEVVERILEAGRLTASSMNGQPWQFIVVEDPERLQQLARAVRTGPYIVQAPLAIVVVVNKSVYAVSDGSRAIQSMILTAWSEGVGSNWVGFHRMLEVSALLGIPDDLEVLAVIPLGYPAQPAGRGKKNRKPLSELVHREQHGQPWKGK